MGLNSFDWVILISYAVICLGIGFWSSRKQKDQDFLIGGRKLGLFGFVSTVVVSFIGGGAFVTYSAYVYEFGISAITFYLGIGIGSLVFIYYARRLRKLGHKHEFHTMADWFYFHFDRKCGLLVGMVLIVIYTGLLSYQFIVGTTILSQVGEISYELGLVVAGIVILCYLFMGGFRSVVKTDIFQYMIFLVLAGVLVYGWGSDGRVSEDLLDIGALGPGLTAAFLVFGLMNYFYSADVWQRVYAATSDQVIRKGLVICAAVFVVVGIAISSVGLYAGTHHPDINPREAAAIGLGGIFPEKLLGLALVLVFAAVMSTCDTNIFVLASGLPKDVLSRFHSSYKGKKYLARQHRDHTKLFVVVFTAMGVLLAYFCRDLIAVVITIAGMQACIVPAVIASFHWKLKPTAVFWSVLTGFLYVCGLVVAGIFVPEYALACMFISAAVLMVLQFVLPKTKRKN